MPRGASTRSRATRWAPGTQRRRKARPRLHLTSPAGSAEPCHWRADAGADWSATPGLCSARSGEGTDGTVSADEAGRLFDPFTGRTRPKKSPGRSLPATDAATPATTHFCVGPARRDRQHLPVHRVAGSSEVVAPEPHTVEERITGPG